MLKVKVLLFATAVILGSFLVLCNTALAVPTYVGSFQTDDGPWWTEGCVVYSAREAAALIFGGVPTDYLVSTDPTMDFTTITNTGFYTTYGGSPEIEFDHDYKLDMGELGYTAGDRTAYCGDHLPGPAFTMYVWTNDVAPPVSGSISLDGDDTNQVYNSEINVIR